MEQATVDEHVPSKGARSREILATLARHGVSAATGHPAAEQLRLACEELGTTFIKLGQSLSTRADLLPADYRAELQKLTDNVPPVPYEEIAAVIRDELGAAPDKLFARFDRTALGSASIGQVHAATLHDGREVVVKVIKPGVEDLVGIDLQILDDLAGKASKRWPVLDEYGAGDLVEEFADTLRYELDFTREAASAELFRAFFQDEPGIKIPEVIYERSSARVITLERLHGQKPAELSERAQRKREVAGERVARFILEPAFGEGVFYADPHSGNFVVMPGGAIGVMDFGMTGRLAPEVRRRVADIFTAFDRRDPERVTDRLLQVAGPTHPVDRAALGGEIARILERHLAADLKSMEFGDALTEMLDVVRCYKLRLPGPVALLFKALVMCEGLIETISPNANMSSFVASLSEKILYQRLNGQDWAGNIRNTAIDAAELSIELPRRVDRVLSEVERGNLRVWARMEDFEPALARFERAIETTNATMLASACIVGLAIVMLVYHPQGWGRWIGYAFWSVVAIAFLFSLRTVWATLKKRKVR
ncbi:MAG TPA: AarF/UbiB family protein [Candidatus Rubrimentiphilum sp.]|nr:AarF/UbiB family protein [Candidatus Rubrimentiphilum sp.]